MRELLCHTVCALSKKAVHCVGVSPPVSLSLGSLLKYLTTHAALAADPAREMTVRSRGLCVAARGTLEREDQVQDEVERAPSFVALVSKKVVYSLSRARALSLSLSLDLTYHVRSTYPLVLLMPLPYIPRAGTVVPAFP